MKAYFGDEEIKKIYLTRVREHAFADEIIKGKYWEDGKGCAVGCTIHSGNHASYETELGIPEWLARVEDTIFEGLPNNRAMKWPEEFLSAINPGANLDSVKAPFLIFVLESTLDKFDHFKFPDVKKAIDTVIDLYKSGETDLAKFDQAAWEAAKAARAAEAAWAAAKAARASWAARAAEAAWEAAWASRAVAEAAWAAWAAAWASWARADHYIKFADKLLELLRETKLEEKP